MPNTRVRARYQILLLVAPVASVLDQITKGWIAATFRLGERMPIVSGFFDLTHLRNRGAAFGIFADHSQWVRNGLTLVTVAVIGLLLYLFHRLPPGELRRPFAYSLILGGALGNLVDRVRLGYVVDFLDFHWKYQAHYPSFNLADVAICSGVGLLFLDSFFRSEETEPSVFPRLNQSRESIP